MFNFRISNLKTDQIIGSGSITKVFSYHENGNDENDKWVVKEIRCSTAQQLNLSIQEIVLGFGQNHKHLNPVTGFNIGWFGQEIVVYTKMPRMKRSLADLIKDHMQRGTDLPEENIIQIFYSISSALEYLTRKNICHRDIKPSSVLLDENDTIKVSDIGTAKYIPSQDLEVSDDFDSAIGTPGYMAPEIFDYSFSQPKTKQGWIKADIWSLGITIVELCLINPRRIMFQTSEEEVMNLVCANLFDVKKRYGEKLSDLLSNMLIFDAESRKGYEYILDSLREMKEGQSDLGIINKSPSELSFQFPDSENQLDQAILNLTEIKEYKEQDQSVGNVFGDEMSWSRFLQIEKGPLEDKHSNRAILYKYIGSVYQKLGEYQKAIDCFSLSLEIYKEVLGDNHPDTATSYKNLQSAFEHLNYYKARAYKKLEEEAQGLCDKVPNKLKNLEKVFAEGLEDNDLKDSKALINEIEDKKCEIYKLEREGRQKKAAGESAHLKQLEKLYSVYQEILSLKPDEKGDEMKPKQGQIIDLKSQQAKPKPDDKDLLLKKSQPLRANNKIKIVWKTVQTKLQQLLKRIPPQEMQIPILEVGESRIYFSLPEDFDAQYTIEIEFGKSNDPTNRTKISISSANPNQLCSVAQGVRHLYRHRTVRGNHATEWSREEGFTPQRQETGIGLLRKRTPDIKNEIRNIKRNILIVGTVGCGKSSLLNTLFRAYLGITKDVAKIYNSDTVIPGTTRYPLENSQINIIDTAGLEKGDHEKMDNVSDLIRGRVENLGIDKIDIIVLVHAFKGPITSKDCYFKECERLFDLLRTSKCPVLGVLTHADTLSSHGEDAITIENYLDHPRVVKKCQELLQQSGIPYVLPFINETTLAADNTTRNEIALELLYAMCKL